MTKQDYDKVKKMHDELRADKNQEKGTILLMPFKFPAHYQNSKRGFKVDDYFLIKEELRKENKL